MSKQLRIWLFVLLGTLLTSTSLLAEGVITMTTDRAVGEKIYLGIKANGNVTIEGAQELGSLTSDYGNEYGNEYVKVYEIKKQTITVRGDVTELYCGVPDWVGRLGYWNSRNSLTSLDVSGCTTLTKLDCSSNRLTSLDVSQNTALTSFDCSSNRLTSLDVSKNTALTELVCSNNQLPGLNVSSSTSLTKLDCSKNQLTNLNLSKNTALTKLVCYNNQLTSLDVSKNSSLTALSCGGNQLTNLDISNNSTLATLDCNFNQLTSLDVSGSPLLNYLDCSANQIKGEAMAKLVASLPIHNNGGNQGGLGKFIIVSNLASEGNVCSKADVATARAKNWDSLKKVDEREELIPYEGEDDNLQVGNGVITMTTTKAVGETIALAIQADGGVTIEGAKTPLQPDGQVAYYTLTSQTVTIRGDVTALSCYDNQLTSLDVSKNSSLTELFCGGDQLTNLDVSQNTALTSLKCFGNQLTSLDVSKNTALTELHCSWTQLTNLDVSKNTSLTALVCNGNQLTSLDVSKNSSLTALVCNGNQLTSLDVSKNSSLTALVCYGNQLTSLDVSKNSSLKGLDCGRNQLTSLKVSGCVALTRLSCSNNQLTSLDLSTCSSLNDVDCSENQIKGESMTQLVASLPTCNSGNQEESGKFIVVSNSAQEGNSCSKANVASARAKNWNSLKRGNRSDLLPYDGEDDNLQVGNGVITMTTTKAVGETIALAIKADGGVAIEGAKIPLQPDGRIAYYTLTSQTITIHGDVTKLDCGDNQLTSLDVSGCTALTQLVCVSSWGERGALTSLNASGCTALKELQCQNNQLTSLDVSGCTSLIDLNCSKNQLTSLDVSGCNALTTLNCSGSNSSYLGNQRGALTSLDVSGCAALTTLYCYNNQLTSLDVSSCTALTELSCSSNQLTSLDVSSCTALTELSCSINQLTRLDVSSCTSLTKLYCWENQLTSLNVSSCTSLTELTCSTNQLTSLDVSSCTSLTKLYCDENQLTSLDVSSCTALTQLVCGYSWGKRGTLTSLNASGCTALKELQCQNNRLTSLNVSGCTALTELDCDRNQLTSLNVSGCKALTTLNCSGSNSSYSGNQRGTLTSLDVSGCTSLTKLDCYNNQLTSLNVSGCTSLTTLECYENQLTSLDVSGCTALTTLNCYGNQLTSLDVSCCTSLTKLECYENQLTSLNVSGCTSLTTLECYENQLTSLDVSGCTALTTLNCYGNQLISLDVSPRSQLNYVNCSENRIKEEAMNQLVSSLPTCTSDFQYPFNQYNYSGGCFIVVSNSAQEGNFCLKSEVASARTKNWTSLKRIDGKLIPYEGEGDNPQQPVGRGIIKMTTTRAVGETIALAIKADGGVTIEGAKTPLQPDGNTAYYTLTSQTIIIRGDLTELNCAGSQLDSLDVSGCPSLIKLSCGSPSGEKGTLTSLKASGCTALTELDCGNNPPISLDVSGCTALTKLVVGHEYGDRKTLTSLNASGCTALTQLDCSRNQLTSLDVSGCTALTSLGCSNNKLTSLNVSGCTALKELDCYDNQLTSLNVSGCIALTKLYCYDNQLTSLDVSGCTALTSLGCEGNQLTSLDVSKNKALRWLNCAGNQLTSLDVSKNTALTSLSCEGNQLTSLDVSGCTSLTRLVCGDIFKGRGTLTSLNASGCTALTELTCQYNRLTNLDVSGCTSLTTLDCWSNQLTSLDLSGCTALTELDCVYNQLTSLDLSKNSSLIELNCYGNALTSLDLSKCLNLRYVDCSDNRIKGEAMNRLVASLPTCSGDYHGQYSEHSSYPGGYFVAVSSSDYEWNNCSKENVASARTKNWTPLKEAKRGFKYYDLKLVPYDGVDLNQPVGHGVITMTTERAVGEPIILLFRANGGVAIEGVKEILQSDGSTTYQILPGQTITFRGDVTALSCGDSELTSLNVSGCPSLIQLDCWDNKLTNLDVSQNRALQRLVCHKNQLTSLDVSQNSFLARLYCYNNQLTSLDISQNVALKLLFCNNNQLTSLDVSQNAALENLYCYNNQLTSLDVSQNLSLYSLRCQSNQLTSLDVSHNSKLRELSCFYNQIKGAEMTKLVNSLPKKDGRQSSEFDVVVKDSIEGNVCLKSDVVIVADKGWTPLGYNRSTEAWEYYGGRETDSFGVSLTHEGEGVLDATGPDNLKAVPYGTKLTITVTPAEGYELAALTANGVDILESKSFVVTGYTEIKATFAKKNFAVTFDKDGEGTITATGADDLNAVAYGTELTIVATPTEGYELTALTANGTDILASKKVIVKEAVEVKATFTKKHFVVTLEKVGDGELSTTGTNNLKKVPYGTELTIIATPAEGYELTSIVVDGVNITATKKIVVKENMTVRATFTKKNFTVSLTKEGEGMISATGATSLNAVAYGTELTIVATPATGYELVSITANGADITASKKIVVKDNLTVKVTFAKKAFIVSLDKSGEGRVNATGAEDLNAVPYGTELTIVATPKQGNELTALTANDKDILATKKVVITEKTTIRATFTKKMFVVTLDKEGEGVLNATGADDLKAVPYGTKLTITATPAEGYELTGLLANGLDILQSKSTVVTEEISIKAIFRKKTFAVKLTNDEHGVISIVEPVDRQRIPYGTELTIEATPKQGYELTVLTANGKNILSTQRFVVKGDTEVKATFTKKTFAVTLDKEGEGKVDATGAENLTAVPYGTELTIVATPKQGYELTALTANNKDILATRKVEVTENLTIKATFTKKTFAVTLDKEGEGKVDATGADNLKAVPYGTKLTITATPAEGYELTGLLANGFDILSTKSVEVTGDTKIKAIFTQQTFAVKLTSNEHGKISIAEPVDLDAVPYGTTLTVKATGKNAQCELTALTANGQDILATKSFVVKGATEIKATFVDHTGVETTVTQQTQLYPNPATDYVIVEGVASASEVTLHSMTGERLYAGRADSRGVLQIDLTPYADGVYLVCVAGETYRVVVRH